MMSMKEAFAKAKLLIDESGEVARAMMAEAPTSPEGIRRSSAGAGTGESDRAGTRRRAVTDRYLIEAFARQHDTLAEVLKVMRVILRNQELLMAQEGDLQTDMDAIKSLVQKQADAIALLGANQADTRDDAGTTGRAGRGSEGDPGDGADAARDDGGNVRVDHAHLARAFDGYDRVGRLGVDSLRDHNEIYDLGATRFRRHSNRVPCVPTCHRVVKPMAIRLTADPAFDRAAA